MNGKTVKLLNGIKGKSHATKRAWLASSQKTRASERRLMARERQAQIAARAEASRA